MVIAISDDLFRLIITLEREKYRYIYNLLLVVKKEDIISKVFREHEHS